VIVAVTDNGTPSLSSTQSFKIYVQEVNSAPAFTPIADLTSNELSTIIINASATDSDIPANHLTFAILSAPANAAITSAGVFTWTPSEAQGPSTNAIALTVTDNGNPSLSTTQRFTIFVKEVNSAPVLAPIASRSIHAGTTVLVTNVATDSDLPTNTLSFSLQAGAPSGAVIDAASGVFTWATQTNQVPGTNLISISVSDNGSPSLSATQTFNVVVVAPLKISGMTQQQNGKLLLNWGTAAGHSYRVEYKTDLGNLIWTQVGSDLPASSDSLSLEVDPVGIQRFYRVTMVQ
jgi:hypothetical protein